jgi:hypothetical protein
LAGPRGGRAIARIGPFEALTRLGFAARGLLYLMIGWLALRTGRAEDSGGILDYLSTGAGRFVLGAMTAGFFAYGAWRLYDAWIDGGDHGDDAKGRAVRTAGAFSGLIHLFLGAAALLQLVDGGGRGGGNSGEQGAETALGLPGGWLWLVAIAAILAAAGFAQIAKAWKLKFLRHLDCPGTSERWVGWLGRAGFLARGIVFLVMATLFWSAAQRESASAAGGLADAMAALPETLRMAVAAGLVLFGLFSFCEAWFRRIETPD